jgi:hypothetical protein
MSSIDVPPAANEGLDTADGERPMPGELIYEYTPQVTQIVEYGASAEAMLMRTAPPPKEGARLDLYLEGPVIAGRQAARQRHRRRLPEHASGWPRRAAHPRPDHA